MERTDLVEAPESSPNVILEPVDQNLDSEPNDEELRIVNGHKKSAVTGLAEKSKPMT